MDFIDPRKQRMNKIRLLIGYFLIGVAIILTTLVLLFSAYGYGVGKDGQIIQNGLVFVSSTPNPAQIYLNGTLYNTNTNSRLELPAGQYTLELKKAGYRPWIRSLGVEGGSVEHFDYPFLFPIQLVTTTVQQYSTQPAVISQSPNRQWLLIQQPGSLTSFYQYDLNNQKQLASTLSTVSVPTGLLTSSQGAQSLQVVQWSTDNQHVLLQHIYPGGSEYILLDRQTPSDSVNLSRVLNLKPTTQLSLNNEKYDQYYLYDTSDETLSTDSLTTSQPTEVLDNVLAFKAYSNNVVLYATNKNSPAGKVNINVLQGNTNSVIQQLSNSSSYLLDITQYGGQWYVVIGSSTDDKVYIYKNPMSQVQTQPNLPLVPVYILKVNQPNFLSFSDNAQFIMAENGTSFAVYDAENEKGYAYNLNISMDPGQHASWVDGDRLDLVTNSHVLVFDYDDANQQTLQPAIDGTIPFFDNSYAWVYSFASSAPSTTSSSGTSSTLPYSLTSTALRIPADQ